MAKPIYLNVDGNPVLTTDVTYKDLLWLFNDFIYKYKKVPTGKECLSKYNLPQQRIINRVLKENDITFNEFMLEFEKVSHVRCNACDYDLYLEKFKNKCNEIGRTLTSLELKNNSYGLPSAQYFYKYCPDKSVKTYDDFVLWCGFKSNKLKKDDDYIITTLINLEKELGRPITRNDISKDKTGFSMITINRIFGSLGNAKKELGLMETLHNQPRSFEYYKKILDDILENIKKQTDRNYISWNDIENKINNPLSVEHKTLTKAFEREGMDIFLYIKEKGFMMNPSNFSFHFTFDDGERVVSILEYEFSKYLKDELNFIYNQDYFRNVLYKTFTNCSGKKDCDYEININGKHLYIEIAGIIYSTINDDWRTHIFKSKLEKEYQIKMIEKEKVMLENNINFLFLFKDDIYSGRYKEIIKNRINEMKGEYAA